MPQTSTRQTPPLEVVVGRFLAICVHPCAAWLSRSTIYRATVLCTYVALGYLLVFGVLHLLSV